MITPNEVRIGNYMEDREGRLCIVEEINKNEFKAYAKHGGKTSLPVHRIPITEEWLYSLGFKQEFYEKDEDDTLDEIFPYYILKILDSEFLIHLKENELYLNDLMFRIKYVHDLQNIIFLITKLAL